MSLKEIIGYILMICFLLVPLTVWVRHFHPFVTMKVFVFTVLIILASALFVIDIILKGRFTIIRSRLLLAVAIYYAYYLILYLTHPLSDKLYFFVFTNLILLFFLISYVCDVKLRDRLIQVLILIALLSSIYSFFQFFGVDYGIFVNYFGSRTSLGMRTFTFFGNPNLLGGFSVFIIPLILVSLLKSLGNKTNRLSIYYAVVLVLSFIALLMSQTRSSWIAVFISLVIFGILYYKSKIRQLFVKHKTASIIALVIIVLFVIMLFLGLKSSQKIFSDSPNAFLNPLTVGIRANYYLNTLKMISDDPIIGKGPGTFNVYYPLYRDNRIAFQLGETNQEFRVEHPHNEHLEILSDSGIIGYLIFIWIVIEAILLLRKNDLISLGITISIIGLLIDGLMTQNLRFVVIASLFWLLIGFANIQNKSSKTRYKVGIMQIILTFAVVVVVMLPLKYAWGLKEADYYVRGGIGYYISNEQNRNEAAVYLFEQALANQEDNKRALYYIAASYKALGENEKAIDYYKKLLSLDPNFIQASYHLGVIYFEMGDFEHARQYFAEHITTNNMYWKSYYGLGVSYLNLGDKQNALKALEGIDEIDKITTIPKSEYLELKKQIAEVYLELGNKEKALDVLKLADQRYPSDEFKQTIKELQA